MSRGTDVVQAAVLCMQQLQQAHAWALDCCRQWDFTKAASLPLNKQVYARVDVVVKRAGQDVQ